jgi:hypothetical protein
MHDITFDKFGHHVSSRKKNGLTDSIGANSAHEFSQKEFI